MTPVSVERGDLAARRRRRRDREQGPAAADRLRAKNRAGRPHLDVERLPDDRAPVGVEQHRDLVVRGVLELLDHELAAAGGRPPVHLPQRLALLVLAHAVQVESGSPAQQHLSSGLRRGTAVGEEPVELDEPRVDEHRTWGGQPDLELVKAERVLDHSRGVLEDIPPAG